MFIHLSPRHHLRLFVAIVPEEVRWNGTVIMRWTCARLAIGFRCVVVVVRAAAVAAAVSAWCTLMSSS